MKKINLPRIMLVGTGSSSGKTTVTIALLQALKEKGLNLTAFKCGPDYIDPMFHSKVMGIKSRNLDLFLCDHNSLHFLLGENSRESDVAIIEGAMGMYDGLSFKDDSYSANHISRITSTPELLVVNVKGKGRSVLASLKGYIDFHENNLKGVILNNCSKAMYKTYKEVIEEELNINCYGFLPNIPETSIGSRHLGLITAEEIDDIQKKINILGETALETIDIDNILELAREVNEITYEEINLDPIVNEPVKIGVAKDKAFNFYYEDNLNLLRRLGAELVYFSPLHDKEIPRGIQGLIFGGGYPEENLDTLMYNESMKASIKEASLYDVPIYAECGGFMYLGESIARFGRTYKGVGIVPGNSHMTQGLVRFGYKTLTAKVDNLMCKKGEKIKCHEFHYSDTDDYGNSFESERPSGLRMETIYTKGNIFAGYPHIHWFSNIKFAENFLKKCGETKPWK